MDAFKGIVELSGFETWISENIFYPHLCLHRDIILHWDSWFPQFWNVCSSGSTRAPPVWSYRFFFSFSGRVEEFLSILSLLNVQTCAFLWASFILCCASCWAFSIWKPSIVSVFFDFSPLSCSCCLEYNSNVRLCILEVRFSLWIFKNSVLFSYALCNICFLIERLHFLPCLSSFSPQFCCLALLSCRSCSGVVLWRASFSWESPVECCWYVTSQLPCLQPAVCSLSEIVALFISGPFCS